MEASEETPDSSTSENLEPDEKPDSWVRQIHGAAVHFADGATVQKAYLQSDFSAVRLSNLPVDTTPLSVCQLLAKLGVTVLAENIRVPPVGNGTSCVADIRVEDPTFAKRACSAVEEKSKAKNRLNRFDVKATAINAPMPQGSSSQRVECKKVHCSWHRPMRTAWMNFKSQAVAQKINDRFVSGKSTVCSQTVKAHGVSGSRPRGAYNTQAFTVMLTDVPGDASRGDVEKTIPVSIRPMHVELGKPSYTCDMEIANALIKSKLMEVGALDWWEDATLGGKRAKAKGRFQSDGDAIRAVAELNGWVLPFNNKLRLNIQAIYSARFKVAGRIYQVLKPTIDSLSPSWLVNHVFLTVYDASKCNGFRVLRLEGEDNKAVAGAKQALEKTLAGEVAMDADKNIIWSPAFTVNGDLFQRIKRLEETLGIAIVRNKRMSRLHLFGPADGCRQAQVHLVKMATEDVSVSKGVKLDDAQFAWACRGGFREIAAVLGRKVALDIISTPKRIVVTGSERDYRVALEMAVAQQEPGSAQPTRNASEAPDCSICWTGAESPIRTACGHTYCADCFEQFCLSGAASGHTDFQLACEGDSSKCKSTLALVELQESLPSRVFEEVLEASFETYIRRRPDVFHFCPKPDCEQIYRAMDGEAVTVFTCPNCLTAVCTRCHVSHPGMTCVEHQDMASGGYAALEEAKERLGIKDCPKCKTPIEKTDGCNHMTCGGCGTHICWECMQTFKESGPCYDHMNRAHGGIGYRW
ncbi:hypothetical protein OQA88_7021 [Cercophora sp. LCS_1]